MAQKYCFVAMPFRPELNFFFLYLQRYLEDKYGLRVERGDADVLTKPLMDKIREQILKADLVIGDVTGNNPNVFYELGLAHANGKPILFMTQDPPEQAPVDIRQFEFIQYHLDRHEELLGRLDNATRNVFGRSYEALHEAAVAFLHRFNADSGLQCQQRGREEFQAFVMRGEQTGGIPAEDQEYLLAQFLLPKIIADFTEPKVIQKYNDWIALLSERQDGAFMSRDESS
ncbi:MAG: nucleoside 2-deoxyribosyltransferase [Pseudomonadota bacterium]|nr:nucleoside 2-deoxyribosyltransferase [Pseudomonadota bacterium]